MDKGERLLVGDLENEFQNYLQLLEALQVLQEVFEHEATPLNDVDLLVPLINVNLEFESISQLVAIELQVIIAVLQVSEDAGEHLLVHQLD